ncbi:MAG TPA: class I fructose-bisphosphate aldolase [Thermoleophilaceae bacterium]|nr:class I fructose-bisphosphate aldolase [Thermoleophilaceae bacterium]
MADQQLWERTGGALKVWAADTARLADAQAAFLHRARCNAAARMGEYVESMEHRLAA